MDSAKTYVTGDIHGEWYLVSDAIDKYKITSEDVVVVLGDAAMNYFEDEQDSEKKEKLNKREVPILFVHGNHEIRPQNLTSYHKTQWRGGVVYVEDAFPYLLFAKDGEVYDLAGKKVMAIGGAYSVDKQYRIDHNQKWFADEQPSAETKARVEQKLEALDWTVDVVLSHTCPYQYKPANVSFMNGVDEGTVDYSTEKWLREIEKKLTYKAWYCGHWHINKRIEKMHFLLHNYETL